MSITKITILKGILLAFLAGTLLIGIFIILVIDLFDWIGLVKSFLLMSCCLGILFIGLHKLFKAQGLRDLSWVWIHILTGMALVVSTSVIVGGAFLHRWMPGESAFLIASGGIMAAIIAGSWLFAGYKRANGNLKPAPMDWVE